MELLIGIYNLFVLIYNACAWVYNKYVDVYNLGVNTLNTAHGYSEAKWAWLAALVLQTIIAIILAEMDLELPTIVSVAGAIFLILQWMLWIIAGSIGASWSEGRKMMETRPSARGDSRLSPTLEADIRRGWGVNKDGKKIIYL